MISILISLFGFMIKFRLLPDCCSRINFEEKDTHFFRSCLFFFDALPLLLNLPEVFIWFWQLTGLLILFSAPKILEAKMDASFRSIAVVFLDQISLSLQAGVTLKSAIKEAVDDEKTWKRNEMMKAFTFFFMGSKEITIKGEFLKKMFQELRWIDQSRARTLEQVKALRWHYKIQDDFRRRSGQLSQQSRIQASVVSILYLFLLVFTLYHFGWQKNQVIVTVSLFFFVAGTVLVFFIGRRHRWKV